MAKPQVLCVCICVLHKHFIFAKKKTQYIKRDKQKRTKPNYNLIYISLDVACVTQWKSASYTADGIIKIVSEISKWLHGILLFNSLRIGCGIALP